MECPECHAEYCAPSVCKCGHDDSGGPDVPVHERKEVSTFWGFVRFVLLGVLAFFALDALLCIISLFYIGCHGIPID